MVHDRASKELSGKYNYPKKKGIKSECSRLMEHGSMRSCRGVDIQRLMNAKRATRAE